MTNPHQVQLYKAHQDLLHKKYGFVHGKPFFSYLEPRDFRLFACPQKNIALLNTGKDVTSAFIKSVNDDVDSGWKLDHISIDYKKLAPLIPVISGAWIGNMEKQFVHAAGFFGNHVDRSDEFRNASDVGQINQLSFPYYFEGQEILIAITRRAGVILYNRIGDMKTGVFYESDEVRLVLQIYDEILSKSIS